MALFIMKIYTTETNFSFSDPMCSVCFNFVEMPTTVISVPLSFFALQDNKIHCLNVLRRSFQVLFFRF